MKNVRIGRGADPEGEENGVHVHLEKKSSRAGRKRVNGVKAFSEKIGY